MLYEYIYSMKDINKEIERINRYNSLKKNLYIFGGINILLLVVIFDYFNCVSIFRYLSIIVVSMIYERYSLMFGTFYGNRKKIKMLLEELSINNDKCIVDDDSVKLKELNYLNSVNLSKSKVLKLTKRK